MPPGWSPVPGFVSQVLKTHESGSGVQVGVASREGREPLPRACGDLEEAPGSQVGGTNLTARQGRRDPLAALGGTEVREARTKGLTGICSQ
jgi:hypothetical protein